MAFAPRAQVRLDADRLPAPAEVQAEATAHVVEDERRASVVAQGADAPGEVGLHDLLVEAGVVAERGHEHAGQVVPRLLCRRHHAVEVVVPVGDEVGAVLGGRARWQRGAPWRSPVVGALGHEDLPATRRRPGDRRAQGRGVGAVLREHRPVGVADGVDEQLGQLDDAGGRAVLAVGQRCLAGAASSTLGWRWPSSTGP
jgi:hypothetical protein